MKKNDWKDRLNVVYSTNPDFGYEMDNNEEQSTLDKDKQNLREIGRASCRERV